MPLLALLVIACQVTCGLHVVRSGQERYWLYLIIALPGLGCLIYFLGIMLPDLLGSRRGRRTLNRLHDSIDPERHLRALRDELEIRDTRDTRVNLADELLRMGQAEEAAQHYQMALRGIHSDAPDILLGLARARFALGDFSGCQASLDQLIAHNPDFRSSDGHLLYARALRATTSRLKRNTAPLAATAPALKPTTATPCCCAGWDASARPSNCCNRSRPTPAAPHGTIEFCTRSGWT
jgi:hypothetical protein